MLTLTPGDLNQTTGAQLLQRLRRQPNRQGWDVQIGGAKWRVYSSTQRRTRTRTVYVNLWCSEAHVQGTTDQTIAEMRKVQRE